MSYGQIIRDLGRIGLTLNDDMFQPRTLKEGKKDLLQETLKARECESMQVDMKEEYFD